MTRVKRTLSKYFIPMKIFYKAKWSSRKWKFSNLLIYNTWKFFACFGRFAASNVCRPWSPEILVHMIIYTFPFSITFCFLNVNESWTKYNLHRYFAFKMIRVNKISNFVLDISIETALRSLYNFNLVIEVDFTCWNSNLSDTWISEIPKNLL